MTETFDHLFGGWKNAKARRWKNPDGSIGGVVAIDSRVDSTLVIPGDAVVWPGASIGDGASIGYGASVGYGDWWISAGPFGKYKRIVTAVFSEKHGLRWWVGCQEGISTEIFKERLESSHSKNGEPAFCRTTRQY